MTNAISPPTETPKMSDNGFEFAAELAVVGAERLIVVRVEVGEAKVEPLPLGNSLEGPAEGDVAGVPLENSLAGEVVAGVCVLGVVVRASQWEMCEATTSHFSEFSGGTPATSPSAGPSSEFPSGRGSTSASPTSTPTTISLSHRPQPAPQQT